MRKLNFEDVKEFIDSYGYSLLSDCYINNKVNLVLKCQNEHLFDWSPFFKGVRAIEIRQKEHQKISFLKERDFDVIIVWQKEYINNKPLIVDKCIEFILARWNKG